MESRIVCVHLFREIRPVNNVPMPFDRCHLLENDLKKQHEVQKAYIDAGEVVDSSLSDICPATFMSKWEVCPYYQAKGTR